MNDLSEFEAVAKAVDVPVLANMTEFGKSGISSRTISWPSAGVRIVIHPVELCFASRWGCGEGLDTPQSHGYARPRGREHADLAPGSTSWSTTRATTAFGHLGVQLRRPGVAKRTESTDIKKGLAGVVVDVTAVSKVNPETNALLYRGYPVQELAEKCTFEEVAYLLWHGELPTLAQPGEFQALERSQRELDPLAKRVIDDLPLTAHPMDVVRTAVSVLGAADPDANIPETDPDKAVRLFAQLPAIVAWDQQPAPRPAPRRAARRPRLLGQLPAHDLRRRA